MKKQVLRRRDLADQFEQSVENLASLSLRAGDVLARVQKGKTDQGNNFDSVWRGLERDLRSVFSDAPEKISSQEQLAPICRRVDDLKRAFRGEFELGRTGSGPVKRLVREVSSEVRRVQAWLGENYELPEVAPDSPSDGTESVFRGSFYTLTSKDKREWLSLQNGQFSMELVIGPFVKGLVDRGLLHEDEVINEADFEAMVSFLSFVDKVFIDSLVDLEGLIDEEEEALASPDDYDAAVLEDKKVCFGKIKEVFNKHFALKKDGIQGSLGAMECDEDLKLFIAERLKALGELLENLVEGGVAGASGWMDVSYKGVLNDSVDRRALLMPEKFPQAEKNEKVFTTPRGRARTEACRALEERADWDSLPVDEKRSLSSAVKKERAAGVNEGERRGRRGRRGRGFPYIDISDALNAKYHGGLLFRTGIEVKHLIAQMDRQEEEGRQRKEASEARERRYREQLIRRAFRGVLTYVVDVAAASFREEAPEGAGFIPVSREDAEDLVELVDALNSSVESEIVKYEKIIKSEDAVRQTFGVDALVNAESVCKTAVAVLEELEFDVELDRDKVSACFQLIIDGLDEASEEVQEMEDLDFWSVAWHGFFGEDFAQSLPEMPLSEVEVLELTTYCKVYIKSDSYEAGAELPEDLLAGWAESLNDNLFAGYPCRTADYIRSTAVRILEKEAEKKDVGTSREQLSPDLLERKIEVEEYFAALKAYYDAREEAGAKTTWQWRLIQSLYQLMEDAVTVGSLSEVEDYIAKLLLIRDLTAIKYEEDEETIKHVRVKLYDVDSFRKILVIPSVGQAQHRATDRLSHRLGELEAAIAEQQEALESKARKSMQLERIAETLSEKTAAYEALNREILSIGEEADAITGEYYARLDELREEGMMMSVDELAIFATRKRGKEELIRAKEAELTQLTEEMDEHSAQIIALEAELKEYDEVEARIEEIRTVKTRLLAIVEAAVVSSMDIAAFSSVGNVGYAEVVSLVGSTEEGAANLDKVGT